MPLALLLMPSRERRCLLRRPGLAKVFAAHGLTLFDVDELSTHGGSIRIYARHADDNSKPVSERAQQLRARAVLPGRRFFARRELRSNLAFCIR